MWEVASWLIEARQQLDFSSLAAGLSQSYSVLWWTKYILKQFSPALTKVGENASEVFEVYVLKL